MMGPGFVYFARHGKGVKIGHARDVKKRLTQLQTGCAGILVLLGAIPGTREDEATIHRIFAPIGLRGEWFCATPELLTFVGWACRRIAVRHAPYGGRIAARARTDQSRTMTDEDMTARERAGLPRIPMPRATTDADLHGAFCGPGAVCDLGGKCPAGGIPS